MFVDGELHLPKQWRRWLKAAGLTHSSGADENRKRRYMSDWACLKGHGRYWRIDCEGNLDMSEPFDDFDRWANSLEKSVKMEALTQEEFINLVKEMLPMPERLRLAVKVARRALVKKYGPVRMFQARAAMGRHLGMEPLSPTVRAMLDKIWKMPRPKMVVSRGRRVGGKQLLVDALISAGAYPVCAGHQVEILKGRAQGEAQTFQLDFTSFSAPPRDDRQPERDPIAIDGDLVRVRFTPERWVDPGASQ